MKGIEEYKKRVRTAVKAFDNCRFGRCSGCPFLKDGCQNKLFVEAAEMLEDYLKNMKELKEL